MVHVSPRKDAELAADRALDEFLGNPAMRDRLRQQFEQEFGGAPAAPPAPETDRAP